MCRTLVPRKRLAEFRHSVVSVCDKLPIAMVRASFALKSRGEALSLLQF